jgi:hypothetical protein
MYISETSMGRLHYTDFDPEDEGFSETLVFTYSPQS